MCYVSNIFLIQSVFDVWIKVNDADNGEKMCQIGIIDRKVEKI